MEAEDRAAFARSLGVGALAALCALALGLGYAFVVARHRFLGRGLLAALAVGPLATPPYVAAIAWVDALGPAGWLPRLCGLSDPRGPSLLAGGLVYSVPSCGLLLGCCLFPLVGLAAAAALLRVPRGALEAARLARGPLGEHAVLWAAAAPAAGAAALVVFSLALVEFAVPQLLRVGVLAESVYLALAADDRPGLALLRSLPLLSATTLALGGALLCWRRPPLNAGEPAPRRPLGRRHAAAAALGCLLALAPGLLNPATSLGLRLWIDPAGGAGGPARAAHVLASAWEAGSADAARSVTAGALTASCGLLLGVAVAWPLRRLRGPQRLLLAAASLLPFALPAPLAGLSTLALLNHEWTAPLYDGLGALVFALGLRFAPLAVLAAWLALHRVPLEQEEAARLCGRHPARAILPQIAPALLAAWLGVYLLAVTEYGASALAAPPGQSVLSVFLVNEAHYGQGAELSGLCALLLGVVLLPLPAVGAGVAWLRWRRRA